MPRHCRLSRKPTWLLEQGLSVTVVRHHREGQVHTVTRLAEQVLGSGLVRRHAVEQARRRSRSGLAAEPADHSLMDMPIWRHRITRLWPSRVTCPITRLYQIGLEDGDDIESIRVTVLHRQLMDDGSEAKPVGRRCKARRSDHLVGELDHVLSARRRGKVVLLRQDDLP